MKVFLTVFLLAGLLACESSDGGDGAPGGGVYYGTCDHRPPASGTCVDYYCDSASDCSDPATNGRTTCETGGTYGNPGAWSTTACPTGGLFGTCTVPTSGDGRLVNAYYTSSDSVGKSVCEMAGGIWTPGA
jgi:hypothetical protein